MLEPLAAELGARALAVDLSEPAEVDRLVERPATVDILVANAALPASGRLDSFTTEQIDRALDVNLRAPIMLAHALAAGDGSSAAAGTCCSSPRSPGKAATPGASLYNATKFGLRGFASALRADLHASGVGVSAVFPGFIRDAGMFADAEVKLPPGVGTRQPRGRGPRRLGAIERNRAEVDVAPLAQRASTLFAGLAPGRLCKRPAQAGRAPNSHGNGRDPARQTLNGAIASCPVS